MLLCFWAGCTDAPDPRPEPARIVLVSLDTVRADSLTSDNAAHLPEIARLRSEGATFTRAWAAASYTLPAHASMLTGLDPAEHPLDGPSPQLAAGAPTLAERLQVAGYRTGGFHEGGYLRDAYGFARGFDRYTQVPRRGLVGKQRDSVLDWISANADDRFFLFLHTYAAHDPYGGWDQLRKANPELALPSGPALRELAEQYSEPEFARPIPNIHRHLFQLFNPLAERGTSRVRAVPFRPVEELRDGPHFELGVAAMRAGYDARVARVDSMIGAIRSHLEMLDLWDDTLLVVISDHGEAFFEHGQPWHGYVPYDEVLRVPWIVSWPRLFERIGTQEITGPAWHLDLVPTLLGLAGVPAERSLAGRDLSAALRGERTLAPDHAVFPLVLEVDSLKQEPPVRIAIHGGLKLIPHSPRFHATGDQIFDLARDPGETRNLLSERSDAHTALVERLAAYEATLRPPPPGGTAAPLGAEEHEALRELGYVED